MSDKVKYLIDNIDALLKDISYSLPAGYEVSDVMTSNIKFEKYSSEAIIITFNHNEAPFGINESEKAGVVITSSPNGSVVVTDATYGSNQFHSNYDYINNVLEGNGFQKLSGDQLVNLCFNGFDSNYINKHFDSDLNSFSSAISTNYLIPIVVSYILDNRTMLLGYVFKQAILRK